MARYTLADVLDAFGATDDPHRAHGWRANCPCHDDEGSDKPSLIIDYNEETKRIVLMCEGRRPQCDVAHLVAAVGLPMSALTEPGYTTHTVRSVRGAAKKTPAPMDARKRADGDSFLAALYLTEAAVEGGTVVDRFRTEYGIDLDGVDVETAHAMGIGLDRAPEEGEQWTTITARTMTGDVAFMQRRDPRPDAKVRWLSSVNPEKGSANESRWDGVGFIGRRHLDAPVVICEGPSDGLAVAALNAYDVVAFRGAWAAAELSSVAKALTGRDVVVIPDADGAGKGAADRVVSQVSPLAKSLRVLTLPEGVGDARELFKAEPGTFAERLTALIESTDTLDYIESVDFDPTPYLGGTDYDRAEATVEWVRASGRDIAWAKGFGFLHFDGTVWVPDSLHAIVQAQTALGLKVRALREADPKLVPGSALFKAWIMLERSFLSVAGALATARGLEFHAKVRREPSEFDARKDEIAVGNGIVNLRTGRLRPMTSADLFTKRLAIDYDENAMAPQWEKFLRDVLVQRDGVTTDEDLVRYMQEVVGYGITGESNKPARYYLLVGGGSNGKSVFTGVLGDVFSVYTKTTAFNTFVASGNVDAGTQAARAQLAGVRLVFTTESEKGEKFGAAFLKSYTGGDLIESKGMGKEPFTYLPQGLVFTATNHKPSVDAVDNGIWRRLRLVMWRRKIDDGEMDLGLHDRLAAEEAAGILRWAVEGAMAYYAKGADALVDEPAQVKQSTAAYRADSDVLHEFIGLNFVEVSGDHKKRYVPAPAAWTRYKQWCEWDGVKPMSKSAFMAAMEERWGDRVGSANDAPQRWLGRVVRSAAEVQELVIEQHGDVLSDDDKADIRERLRGITDDHALKYNGRSGARTLSVVS